VQVNGTSVVNNGVANIPLASSDGFGVVKAHYSYGVGIDSNTRVFHQPGKYSACDEKKAAKKAVTIIIFFMVLSLL
jgi:hypothetical protein